MSGGIPQRWLRFSFITVIQVLIALLESEAVA